MDTYTNNELWENFESDMGDTMSLNDLELAAWLEYLRITKMTNDELLAEVTELDRMIETEDFEEEVKVILRVMSARYWDVYSVRLANEMSELNVK
jgi:hypothetical protein